MAYMAPFLAMADCFALFPLSLKLFLLPLFLLYLNYFWQFCFCPVFVVFLSCFCPVSVLFLSCLCPVSVLFLSCFRRVFVAFFSCFHPISFPFQSSFLPVLILFASGIQHVLSCFCYFFVMVLSHFCPVSPLFPSRFCLVSFSHPLFRVQIFRNPRIQVPGNCPYELPYYVENYRTKWEVSKIIWILGRMSRFLDSATLEQL